MAKSFYKFFPLFLMVFLIEYGLILFFRSSYRFQNEDLAIFSLYIIIPIFLSLLAEFFEKRKERFQNISPFLMINLFFFTFVFILFFLRSFFLVFPFPLNKTITGLGFFISFLFLIIFCYKFRKISEKSFVYFFFPLIVTGIFIFCEPKRIFVEFMLKIFRGNFNDAISFIFTIKKILLFFLFLIFVWILFPYIMKRFYLFLNEKKISKLTLIPPLFIVFFLLISGFSLNYIKFSKNKSSTGNKKNIVFIIMESVRADKIGFYGNKENLTPNIDALAKKSLVFLDNYSPSIKSELSVPALVTSYNYMLPLKKRPLPLNEILKKNGYKTALISDYPHYDLLASTKNQWDYFELNNKPLFILSSIPYIINSLFSGSWFCLKENFRHYFSHKHGSILDEIENFFTLNFENFYLQIHLQGAHDPYGRFPYRTEESIYSEEFALRLNEELRVYKNNIGKEKLKILEKIYEDSIKATDKIIAKVIEILERKNLISQTIIVITSDHGESFGEHGETHHGTSFFNSMVKVPLIIYVSFKKPEIFPQAVSGLDIVPTVLNFLGLSISSNHLGVVLPDFLSQNRIITSVSDIGIMLVKNNYKLILTQSGISLYNLSTDKDEKENIASERKEIVKEILSKTPSIYKDIIKKFLPYSIF